MVSLLPATYCIEPDRQHDFLHKDLKIDRYKRSLASGLIFTLRVVNASKIGAQARQKIKQEIKLDLSS
ncbi:MAG: hypothetical protein C0508_11165 [Cyanobacteria bacterium PR.023]|nr:hypothetical protein [Cyanobacteria bacterium PR.023]